MDISGTEPSSVALSQTCSIKKLKSYDQKVPKQAEAKRDGVINPQRSIYGFYIKSAPFFGDLKKISRDKK